MRDAPPQRVIDRLRSRTVPSDGGCLITTYSVGSHGYGQVGWNREGERVVTTTHRVAWFAERGDIPDELVVDHTCHNRRCVNVEHMQLLSRAANAARQIPRTLAATCGRGHPFDESNTYVASDGHRGCKECRRIHSRNSHLRRLVTA